MKIKSTIVIAAALFSCIALNAQTTNIPEYSVQEVLEKAPDLVGQTIKVKGLCQHVCQVSGRKLFLSTPDGKKTVRINAGKNIKKFDSAVIDSVVTATGVVTEIRISMDALKKQEAIAEKMQKAKKEAEHCTSEAKAEGSDINATPVQRIKNQEKKLKKQIKNGGKDYLSNYMINQCNEYSISK